MRHLGTVAFSSFVALLSISEPARADYVSDLHAYCDCINFVVAGGIPPDEAVASGACGDEPEYPSTPSYLINPPSFDAAIAGCVTAVAIVTPPHVPDYPFTPDPPATLIRPLDDFDPPPPPPALRRTPAPRIEVVTPPSVPLFPVPPPTLIRPLDDFNPTPVIPRN